MSRENHTLTEAREIIREHNRIIKPLLAKAGFKTKLDLGAKVEGDGYFDDGYISFPVIEVAPKGEDMAWLREDKYYGLFFNDDDSNSITIMAISSGSEFVFNIHTDADAIVAKLIELFQEKDMVEYYAIKDKDERYEKFGC